nr:hypothetical protein [Tanacetum cinerariifolium]
MDLDKEEEDPEIDVDDEEEEPLPASPPLLSQYEHHLLESSFDYDIPVTTTTFVGKPFKGPLSTYKQELYRRGFEENFPTESIDVLATYKDADPLKLQEPSDTQ